MIKKFGFTILELIITMTMTIVLAGAVVLAFRACLRLWDAMEYHSSAKSYTQLAQAVDLIVTDIRGANNGSVSTDGVDGVNFTLGSTPYRYYLYSPQDGPYPLTSFNASSYNLLRSLQSDPYGQGQVIATDACALGSSSAFGVYESHISTYLYPCHNQVIATGSTPETLEEVFTVRN